MCWPKKATGNDNSVFLICSRVVLTTNFDQPTNQHDLRRTERLAGTFVLPPSTSHFLTFISLPSPRHFASSSSFFSLTPIFFSSSILFLFPLILSLTYYPFRPHLFFVHFPILILSSFSVYFLIIALFFISLTSHSYRHTFISFFDSIFFSHFPFFILFLLTSPCSFSTVHHSYFLLYSLVSILTLLPLYPSQYISFFYPSLFHSFPYPKPLHNPLCPPPPPSRYISHPILSPYPSFPLPFRILNPYPFHN